MFRVKKQWCMMCSYCENFHATDIKQKESARKYLRKFIKECKIIHDINN